MNNNVYNVFIAYRPRRKDDNKGDKKPREERGDKSPSRDDKRDNRQDSKENLNSGNRDDNKRSKQDDRPNKRMKDEERNQSRRDYDGRGERGRGGSARGRARGGREFVRGRGQSRGAHGGRGRGRGRNDYHSYERGPGGFGKPRDNKGSFDGYESEHSEAEDYPAPSKDVRRRVRGEESDISLDEHSPAVTDSSSDKGESKEGAANNVQSEPRSHDKDRRDNRRPKDNRNGYRGNDKRPYKQQHDRRPMTQGDQQDSPLNEHPDVFDMANSGQMPRSNSAASHPREPRGRGRGKS